MNQHRLFVILAVVLAGASAQAQGRGGAAAQAPVGTPPAPIVRTSSISGQVVDADTGAPIGGAFVRLQSRLLAAAAAPAGGGRGAGAAGTANPFQPAVPPGTDAVITDGDGRFVFHDLPKGATQVTATASGFLDRPAGGAPQRPLQLEDGQHLDGVRLRLLKVASVTGVVLDEAGEPVVGLTVRVLRREVPGGIPRFALSGNARTDDRGQYRLDNLAPGQLYVLAPQTQTTVPVAEAERNAAPLVNMNPLIEAMTGGTQTSFGGAGVRVGDQMLRTNGDIGGPGNAPPPPVNGRIAAYQTTFYPGVTQVSQAMALTLRSGEDRAGIDFQIRPTASARVSGVLMGSAGPASGTLIRLVPAPGRADDDALVVATAVAAADGAFTFLGVPTGQYIVKARVSPRGGMPNIPAEAMANFPPEMLAAMQSRSSSGESSFMQAPLAVGDRDVAGLALALRLGAKLSGQVVFDGAAVKPAAQQLANVQISFAQQGGASGPGNVQTRLTADATFKTSNYAPGMYTAAVTGLPAPWLLRSVTIGGREVIASGIEIGENDLSDVQLTFTDRPSTVTGFVRQDSNGPLPNTTVLLISAEYRTALNAGATPRQQTAVVQPNGAFTFGRLLPGDYDVVAVPDETVPIDRDVTFFEAVTRAGTRVTVAEGETKSQDLKIVRSIR